MAGFNLPPGGGFYSPAVPVRHKCHRLHTWDAMMFMEMGGWFYENEENAYCPKCGEESISTNTGDAEKDWDAVIRQEYGP